MASKYIPCLWIGELAWDSLPKSGMIGTVFSIFNRSFHLLTSRQRIISITRNDLPKGPLNITTSLSIKETMRDFGLEKGDPVNIQSNLITIGKKKLFLSLTNSKVWSSDLPFQKLLQPSTQIRLNLNRLLKLILNFQNKVETTAQHNHDLKISVPETSQDINFEITLFGDLKRSILDYRIPDIRRYTRKLIGRGQGLTPFMDDMIMGLIVGMLFSAPIPFHTSIDKQRILLAILKQSTATTRLSYSYLHAATKGQINEDMYDLIEGVLTLGEDAINQRAKSVFSFGSSSGIAIAYGIIHGIEIGLEMRKRIQ